jgi:transposase
MVWDAHARQVVKDVAEGKITRYRASTMLGVVVRTVQRKVEAYRRQGELCFKHGNTGKPPANKINLETIMQFIIKHDLEGCNFTELCRLLDEYQHIKVSSSCIRKRFFDQGILSVKCKKKTRKKLQKFIKELLRRKQEVSRQTLEVLSALKQEDITGVWNHPTKSKSKYFGERLEMDASSFIWIKGLGTCTLHVCIDDASGFLLGLWLEHEETLHGYYNIMEQVLQTYGIPVSIRTDKRTVFVYNKKGQQAAENDTMTQFAFACNQLGIELQCNSDPDFKPKVERANQTLQGILPFRFTLENIHSLEQANVYLKDVFMPYFNSLFGYERDYVDGKLRTINSAFVECSADQIRSTLAVLCERTVNKGNSIQLDNTFFALLDATGKRIALAYHTKVTVARLLDGSLYATKDDRCYALEAIPDRHAFSHRLDPEQDKPKIKAPRPKVPAHHPWSYQKQKQFIQHDALMKSLEPYYKSPYESRYA